MILRRGPDRRVAKWQCDDRLMNSSYPLSGKRVWVAGHRGLVGSAIVRRLAREDCEVLTIGRDEVDLTRQSETEAWMAAARPHAIFLAAARVGGIHANDTYPADFIYDNLLIEANIIHAAHRIGVEKLLFLGSSCIYPREAPQPIPEASLLTGPLEPTNEWYAIAKIAGIKLCQAFRRQYGCDFISAMPTNLYGPGDNFHPENSHVPAALLRRMHDAKRDGAPSITVWGTGRPRREFLYVDDMADACIFLLKHYSGEQHVNVGTGVDISIGDFAALVKRTVGYDGQLAFDPSRPDGTPRKVMDVSTLKKVGWKASTSLEEGLKRYYEWFLANIETIRK
jgi:GDP-L-fucose synthase